MVLDKLQGLIANKKVIVPTPSEPDFVIGQVHLLPAA